METSWNSKLVAILSNPETLAFLLCIHRVRNVCNICKSVAFKGVRRCSTESACHCQTKVWVPLPCYMHWCKCCMWLYPVGPAGIECGPTQYIVDDICPTLVSFDILKDIKRDIMFRWDFSWYSTCSVYRFISYVVGCFLLVWSEIHSATIWSHSHPLQNDKRLEATIEGCRKPFKKRTTIKAMILRETRQQQTLETIQ